MAEMTLIKLGEVVDMPQVKRSKLIERQAEEARKAREARAREEGRSATERAERQRQAVMNEQAYIECRACWEQLTVAMMAGSAAVSESARTLAKRVAHRAELRLVTSAPADVKRLPPASFVAMGTSGLEPTELRAVLHALTLAGSTSTAAQNLVAMLQGKVAALDDFVPSPTDLFEGQSADAPLGMASGRGTTRARAGSSSSSAAPAAAPPSPPTIPALPAPPGPLVPPVAPPAPPAPPPPLAPQRRSLTSTSPDPRTAMLDELMMKASKRMSRASLQATSTIESPLATVASAGHVPTEVADGVAVGQGELLASPSTKSSDLAAYGDGAVAEVSFTVRNSLVEL